MEAGEVTSLLAMVSILRGIPRGELEELGKLVQNVRYKPGEAIFRRGEFGDRLLIVISGQVRIHSCGPDGNEMLLNIIEPQEVVGEIAALDGGPRTADVSAAVDTEALVLQRSDLLPFLEKHPRAAVALMDVLCQRIRQTTAFLEDAVLLEVPLRVLGRLEALAEQHGQPEGPGVYVDHGLTQQEIAEFVGVSRVSVSKVLTTWRDAGVIEYGRGFVRILDLARLRRLAAAPPKVTPV